MPTVALERHKRRRNSVAGNRGNGRGFRSDSARGSCSVAASTSAGVVLSPVVPNRVGDPNGREHLSQLMLGYQKGDPDSAAELVEIVSPMLMRFLAAPSLTRAYAEDMLQECWLRIHRARHTYRPGAAVLPWLYGIARHVRVDSYRRVRRVNSNEIASSDCLDSVSGADGRTQIADLNLWRIVAQIPGSQREVILMLKVSGMTCEEVALATRRSVVATKQIAHRAYVKLRSLWRDEAKPGANEMAPSVEAPCQS